MFSQRGTPVLSHGFDILKELPLAFSTGTRELSIRSMFESFRTRCHEEQHGEGKSFILVFAAFFLRSGTPLETIRSEERLSLSSC